MATRTLLPLVVAVLASAGCRREYRPIHPVEAEATRDGVTHRDDGEQGAGGAGQYEYVAWSISEGKTLYTAFNCNGCHAYGGGSIGPPLMDDAWIYGGTAREIYASIVDGRPNGMPAFRGRIAEYQLRQIVAYVRSMGGHVPFDAAPGRNDDLFPGQPENSRETARGPASTSRARRRGSPL